MRRLICALLFFIPFTNKYWNCLSAPACVFCHDLPILVTGQPLDAVTLFLSVAWQWGSLSPNFASSPSCFICDVLTIYSEELVLVRIVTTWKWSLILLPHIQLWSKLLIHFCATRSEKCEVFVIIISLSLNSFSRLIPNLRSIFLHWNEQNVKHMFNIKAVLSSRSFNKTSCFSALSFPGSAPVIGLLLSAGTGGFKWVLLCPLTLEMW